MSEYTQHLYSRGPFPSYTLLPPHPMDGEEIRKLWCLLDGDTVPFEVHPGLSFTVDSLKDIIKQKQLLHDVAASHLVLWQVRIFYTSA